MGNDLRNTKEQNDSLYTFQISNLREADCIKGNEQLIDTIIVDNNLQNRMSMAVEFICRMSCYI
jgi:hypothetical protein